jgi:sRNA-binding carbon storage regulator CsrA
MLSMMRKIGQDIYIVMPDGRQINVRLSEAEPGRAHISIDAPPDVALYRSEVWDRLSAGPTCLASSDRGGSTLCGLKWESGDNVLPEKFVANVPGDVCAECLSNARLG